MNQENREIKQVRCHWCGRFLSQDNRQSTIKEPNIFYCRNCYKKGYEMELEAMGANEPNYYY